MKTSCNPIFRTKVSHANLIHNLSLLFNYAAIPTNMKTTTILCAAAAFSSVSAFSPLNRSPLTQGVRSSTAVNAFWDKKKVVEEPVVEVKKKGGFFAKKASVAATAAKPAKPVKKGIEAQKKENAKKRIATNIFEMDLFSPYAARNDYGQRKNKNIKLGTITKNSYVPAGLTQQQYADLRKAEKAKKDQNYARNVAKGGKFQDYTDFYIKRGTDKNDDWMNSVTNSHTMAKTKYDWGAQDLSIKNFATEDKKKRKRKKNKSY